MARISIPCLVLRTSKASVTSWYWQPSKTLREAGFLPEALGKVEGIAIARAQALNAMVDEWKRGGALPRLKARVAGGTVADLIRRYRREIVNGTMPNGSPRIARSTASTYETALGRIDAWAGRQPLAFVTRTRVRVLRDAIARPVAAGGIGHGPALSMLKTARQLFAFAEAVEMIPPGVNPFVRFDLGAVPPRGVVWEMEDDAAFDAAAHDLGLPGMALARELALYTAQRQADLLAFTEHQLVRLQLYDSKLHEMFAGADGAVWGWVFAQRKTSTAYARREMQIPLVPAMAVRCAEAIRRNRARDRAMDCPRLTSHVLVHDDTGTPWKKRHFIRMFETVRAHAASKFDRPAMDALHWHDLRRTRVVRLRRTGMPREMIASITGHDPKSIEEMLKIYGPVDPTITAAALASDLRQGRA